MATAADEGGSSWDRSYKPGDILIDYCDPVVKCLLPSLRHLRCNNCFVKIYTTKKCHACLQVSYCGRKCQVEDWRAGHKVECSMLKNEDFLTYCKEGSSSENKFLVLRIYSIRNINPLVTAIQHTMWDGTQRSIDTLPYFKASEETQEAKMLVCTNMAMFINKLKEDQGEGSIPVRPDHIERWIGVMIFAILGEDDTNRIGCGIYVEPGCLGHDCKPTVTYVNTGLKIQVRVIAHIKQGQKPTLGFVKGHLDKAARRKEIHRQFNFDCRCQTCQSNLDDNVDYEELTKLTEKLRLLRLQKIDRHEWGIYYTTLDKVLDIFSQIYYNYDERVTHQKKWAFDVAKNCGIHKMQLQLMRDNARDYLLITYGKDHPYFKNFTLFADR